MSEQLDAALALARRGFRIFPLRAYGKKPAVGAFQFVATTDETTIRAWWDMEPRYNVGVLTTDIVVWDLDTKRGHDAVGNYQKIGGHFNTLVVQTASNGYHCYFDGPDSKLAAGVVPGVDIRSHNGYVVGPGSYVDAAISGELDITASGYYTIYADLPMQWVPAPLETLLEKPGRRVRIDVGVDLDTPSAIANATEWLKHAEPAIEGLGGDNKTYETAAKLVRDYALSEEVAFQLMVDWNERCQPPWDHGELWRKVENAAAYGQGDLGAARPELQFTSVVEIPTPLAKPAYQRGVYMGNLYDAADITKRPFAVDRLLLRGDVTAIAGMGSAGKSAFMLAAMAHWAVGKDFGPYRLSVPGKPLRSLVYNAEDDRAEQSRRMIAVCQQFNLDYPSVKANIASMDDADGELLLAVGTSGAVAQNAPAVQYLIDAIRHEEADIFSLDPLVNLHTANENDNGQMRYVVSILRRIARETATAGWAALHTGKGSRAMDKGDADAIRGAGSIVNSVRVAVLMSGISDDDKKEYGISDHEAGSFARIDDAKANMFQKAGGAVAYLKWNTVKLTTGDLVGVPIPTNIRSRAEGQSKYMANELYAYMVEQATGSINLEKAATHLQFSNELYAKMAKSSLRALIQKSFRVAVRVEGEEASIVCEHDANNVLVKLV